MDFDRITKDITARKFSPVYYFHGEEPYFIDKLTKLIEKNALDPSAEAFNKAVVYGPDFKAGRVLGELRSFPMMSDRRLVMVKEAQRVRKEEWEKVAQYLENPLDTTVFVVAFKGKGKRFDGRSKIGKLMKEKAVTFESKVVYEDKIAPWITRMAQDKGFTVDVDAMRVLVAYLGNNLGLIENEMDKIFLFLAGAPEKRVTVQVVYEMINIDKDFNVFELLNHLGTRDHAKCHFIINQMMKNVKDNPPVMILGQLFRFYDDLALINSGKLTSDFEVARKLGKHQFIARRYLEASRNYRMSEIKRNLTFLLEADLQLKGIQHTHLGQEHVMKMLVFKLLN